MAESGFDFVRKNPTAVGLVVSIIGFGYMVGEMRGADREMDRRVTTIELSTQKLTAIEADGKAQTNRLDRIESKLDRLIERGKE